MFEKAMNEAFEKDQQKGRGEELVGAFWGLPSTFKGENVTDRAYPASSHADL